MGRLLIRPRAVSDIREIGSYLEAQRPETGLRFVAAVRDILQRLAEMPKLGRQFEFRKPVLRSLRFKTVPGFAGYLVVYRPLKDGVDVLRIIHGARDLGDPGHWHEDQ